MWPVDTPPKGRLRTSLAGTSLQSPKQTFAGPLNVLIALQGVAQGAVEVSKTKEAYDQIPAPPPALDDDEDDTLADG